MRDILDTGRTSDLSDAFSHLNIEEISNRLYFGPQAEIMEALNTFNDNHDTNLKITKTFRWSPGTYDMVKELFSRRLGFDRRASSIYSLLNREDYFRRAGWISIRDQLGRLDNKLVRLRWDRVVWLDDPSVAIERFSNYTSYIQEKYKEAHDFVQDSTEIDDIYWILEYNDNARARYKYSFCIQIVLNPKDGMNIYKSNRSEGTADLIQNIPIDLDICIKLVYNPINNILGNSNFDSNVRLDYNSNGTVETHDGLGSLRFPYLSSSDPDYYSSICYGDMNNDIDMQLKQFNLLGYLMSLTMWAKSYNQHTGPHHNIKYLYHGEPKWLTEDYRSIFGTKTTGECGYEPDGEGNDYCDLEECTLRHVCDRYKHAYPEPMTPEKAQELTLQWATRMGGIRQDNNVTRRFANPSAGNLIHGGEVPAEEIERQEEIETNEAMDREAPTGLPILQRIIPTDDPRTSMEQAADAEDRPENPEWSVERVEAFLQDIAENPEPDEGDNHEPM